MTKIVQNAETKLHTDGRVKVTLYLSHWIAENATPNDYQTSTHWANLRQKARREVKNYYRSISRRVPRPLYLEVHETDLDHMNMVRKITFIEKERNHT